MVDETTSGTMSRHVVVRTSMLVASVVLALALAAVIAWAGASALLIVFAGVLLGVIFDSAARLLARFVPFGRRVRLAIVVVLIAAVLLSFLAVAGAMLFQQAGQMVRVFDEQVGRLTDALKGIGIDVTGAAGAGSGMMPDMGRLAGGATHAIFSLFGAVGNLVFIVFLGAFFAADPGVYKRGVVHLVPSDKRERVADVLDQSGEALRHWLAGQLFGMAVIFLFSLVLLWLIGMPYPVLLALQAGLLTFIPTIGPVFAGIPIVLAGLAEGPQMALWGIAAYALIELAEGNFITPLIQQRAVHLPPAFPLGFQLLMGALFGILGIALAVPIAAAGKTILEELYVKDALGGFWRDGRQRPTSDEKGAAGGPPQKAQATGPITTLRSLWFRSWPSGAVR